MSSKATIPPSHQRKLHAKSGNRCAKCKTLLVDGATNDTKCIGANAHIYGEKPGAARYDASLPENYVNSYENLIFLCANCHLKVDGEEASFPVEVLHKMKAEHENWVEKQLAVHSQTFTVSEIDVVVKYLIGNTSNLFEYDYKVIDISSKIGKNNLASVKNLITMGMTQIHLVEQYFNFNPDISFGDRLTEIVVNQYREFKHKKMESEEIFHAMINWASNNSPDFSVQAAALSIITYFFEKCEIFEK